MRDMFDGFGKQFGIMAAVALIVGLIFWGSLITIAVWAVKHFLLS